MTKNLRAHPQRRTLGACLASILFPAGAAALACGAAVPAIVQAATVTVTSTADPGSAGTCTLRQAIVSMNDGAVAGSCVNTGAAFRSGDTIGFASGLFGAGTASITVDSPLYIGHGLNGVGGVDAMYLHIDAGTGRKVVVERAAGDPERFSVMVPVMGYYSASGSARGRLHLTGLAIRNGVAHLPISKYGPDGSMDKYGVNAGGGIVARNADIVIDRSEIVGNSATVGGGVYVQAGTLTIATSIVSGNTATGSGSYQQAGWGGGVAASGAIGIRESTITGNTSTGTRGGAAVASWFGGVSLVNSTVSGNAAPSATGRGVALDLMEPYTPIALFSSTIACNTGPAGSRAIGIGRPSHTTMSANSTLFANTSNSRCTTSVTREIVAGGTGIVVAGERNLVVTGSAIDGSATFATMPMLGDPVLGPLQDNGGPTPTHAIGTASVARNQGANPLVLPYDQRGADRTRSVGGRADIGAFEIQSAGFCGVAHGASFATLVASSPGLCAGGAQLQGFFGTGPWSWFCALPADPGNNEFCGATVLASVGLSILDASDLPISTATWRQPLRLRASVTGSVSTPTGSVSFTDVSGGGAVPICTQRPLTGGQATCDTAALPPMASGSRQLRANYHGSGVHGAASSAAVPLVIVPATTATTVASVVPDPGALGLPYTVVADVVLAPPSIGEPRGYIEVRDETDGSSCSYPLSAAAPGCALLAQSAGTHELVVAFIGDGNSEPSDAAALHEVMRGATATSLMLAPATITLGESTSVAATIATSVPPAITVPTGTVTVGGAGNACDVVLPATACALAPRMAGTQQISGTYPGDANFAGSDGTAMLDVARAPTSATVSVSPPQPVLGATLTISIDVTSGVAPELATPGGTVRISEGGVEHCAIVLPATDCTWVPPQAGTHALIASYDGDANFMPAESTPEAFEVERAATTIALSLSAGTITLGDPVEVSAGVMTDVPPGIAAPTGALLVDNGAGDGCTITPPEESCSLTPTSAGAQTITATYAGDANFLGDSASAALNVAHPPAQLVLAIDDGVTHAGYGETLTYTITLTNTGQGPTGNLDVAGTPSANVAGAMLSWTCIASTGATCAASGSGTSLADLVTLPADGWVTWTVLMQVPVDADGHTVAFAVEAGDANASDSDTLVLFRNGFD